MVKAYSLWHMSSARSPDHGIFEGLFKRAMNLITDFLYGRSVANDKCFTEVGFVSFSVASQLSVKYASLESQMEGIQTDLLV